MKEFLLVFAGGGSGAVLRFLISRGFISFWNYSFPLGTFIINVAACLILGLVMGIADQKQLLSTSSRLFWIVGFCGGFSTFSAFSRETLELLQNGQNATVALYVIGSVVVCVAATFGGLLLVRMTL